MLTLICKSTCSTCGKAVALLREREIPYVYREYTKQPLSADELRAILATLAVGPRDVLRSRDANALGLRGDEDGDELIALMAQHPTLVQRPIGLLDGRAVVGRPPERLLELFDR
ncbi:MAG: arsenate reductase family protein [Myxococcota bacterium]